MYESRRVQGEPRIVRVLGILAVVALAACGVQEQDAPVVDDVAQEGENGVTSHDHADPTLAASGVGSVAFATSCSAEAQPRFEEAVAMLHSFWFDAAEVAFMEVSRIDPDCAMAHWGLAMTLWGNPMTRVAPSDARISEAIEAIREARRLAPSATERERMYIEAVAALYDDYPEVGHLQRMRAHEAAMGELRAAFPEDPEAHIFYGRIVVGNAPPDDLTFSRQLYAAEIMEPLFLELPGHPGLAHYLIHAFDAPAIAEEGLDAALRYADIAPHAPHALHMPTHIFTRMGYWEESIELNARSAAAEPNPDAAVHPLDYMVYAYLQLGRDREAGEVVSRSRDIPDRYYGGTIGYNFAAMQARYPLERDRWEDAAAIPPPVDDTLPHVAAVIRFARALGSARAGQIDRAAEELDALRTLVDRLDDAGEDYWRTVVEAQRLAAEAWLAHARGDTAGAMDLAVRAAELEGTVEKHPVTPGPLLPARELLGDLYLELDRPAEALAAYTATLEQERNRARALFGAARSAEAAGELGAADRHFAHLRELLANADPDRPDFQAAMARN